MSSEFQFIDDVPPVIPSEIQQILAYRCVSGYVHKENDGSYSLVTWDGSKTLCQLTNTSKWKNSGRYYISSHQFAWTAMIDGIKYNGRNGGEGLHLCMRVAKKG